MEENKIVIYQTEDGQTQIDVRLENDTVWLNVTQMSALFDKEESNVRRHILNVFREGELERDENNVQKIHVNGVKKPVPFYSLDFIISASLWDRYLGMTAAMTQVPVPTATLGYINKQINKELGE